MDALPLFVRLSGRPVLVLGDGAAADAKRRLVHDAGGAPVDHVGPDVRLAFVAIGDGADVVADDLRARGLLVNVVDQPALCDFTVPAVVDRAPLMVAIGTGGASASLAKAVKERLERMLDPSLGALGQAVLESRAAVAAVHPTVPARRAFWAGLMAPGAPLDPFAPVADIPAAIARALCNAPAPVDRVDRIAIGAGGADALTLAQLRMMAAADLVVHPADVPAAVMALVRRDADRLVGKAPPAGVTGRTVVLLMEA